MFESAVDHFNQILGKGYIQSNLVSKKVVLFGTRSPLSRVYFTVALPLTFLELVTRTALAILLTLPYTFSRTLPSWKISQLSENIFNQSLQNIFGTLFVFSMIAQGLYEPNMVAITTRKLYASLGLQEEFRLFYEKCINTLKQKILERKEQLIEIHSYDRLKYKSEDFYDEAGRALLEQLNRVILDSAFVNHPENGYRDYCRGKDKIQNKLYQCMQDVAQLPFTFLEGVNYQLDQVRDRVDTLQNKLEECRSQHRFWIVEKNKDVKQYNRQINVYKDNLNKIAQKKLIEIDNLKNRLETAIRNIRFSRELPSDLQETQKRKGYNKIQVEEYFLFREKILEFFKWSDPILNNKLNYDVFNIANG